MTPGEFCGIGHLPASLLSPCPLMYNTGIPFYFGFMLSKVSWCDLYLAVLHSAPPSTQPPHHGGHFWIFQLYLFFFYPVSHQIRQETSSRKNWICFLIPILIAFFLIITLIIPHPSNLNSPLTSTMLSWGLFSTWAIRLCLSALVPARNPSPACVYLLPRLLEPVGISEILWESP